MAGNRPYNPINGEDDTPAPQSSVIDDGSEADELEEELDDIEGAGNQSGGSFGIKPGGFEAVQTVSVAYGARPSALQQIENNLRNLGENKLKTKVEEKGLKAAAKKIWNKLTGKGESELAREAEKKAAQKAEESALKSIGEDTAKKTGWQAVKATGGKLLRRFGIGTEEGAAGGAEGAAEGGTEGGIIGAAEGGGTAVVKKLAGPLAAAAITTYEVRNDLQKDDHRAAAGDLGAGIGGTLAGIAAGAGAGTLLGVETGPGAIATGIVGGVIGGFVGKKGVEKLYDKYKDKFDSAIDKLPEWVHKHHDTPPKPTSTAAVPTARPDSRNLDSLNQATSRTFTAGDSLCVGISGCLGGDVVNLAVVGSHVTTQGGLKGALQQVDEIMQQAHRGDKVLFLTGRNDIGSVNSPAYEANLERIARELKFMQDQGIEVTWLMPVAGGDKNDSEILKMAALQQKVADRYGVHTKSVDGEYERGADGVHLKTYTQLAHDATAGSSIKVGPQNKRPQASPPAPTSTNAHNGPQNNYSNMTPTAATAAREQQAIDYFMHEGWTRVQAAAIVGNQTRESGQNASIQGDKDRITGVMHAYGIGQWRDDSGRQEDFKNYIGHDIHQATYEEELRFTNYELRQGKYKNVGAELAQQTTLEDATHLLRKRYEAPADKLGQEDGIRTAFAQRAYDASLSHDALAANNTRHPGNMRDVIARNAPAPGGGKKQHLAEAEPVHPASGGHAHGEEAHPVS